MILKLRLLIQYLFSVLLNAVLMLAVMFHSVKQQLLIGGFYPSDMLDVHIFLRLQFFFFFLGWGGRSLQDIFEGKHFDRPAESLMPSSFRHSVL